VLLEQKLLRSILLDEVGVMCGKLLFCTPST